MNEGKIEPFLKSLWNEETQAKINQFRENTSLGDLIQGTNPGQNSEPKSSKPRNKGVKTKNMREKLAQFYAIAEDNLPKKYLPLELFADIFLKFIKEKANSQPKWHISFSAITTYAYDFFLH